MNRNRTIPLSLLAAALAVAPLVAPSSARAQTSSRPATSSGTRTGAATLDPGLKLTGLIGFERAEGETGLALRVDGEKDVILLADQLKLAGVVSVGYARFSQDGTVIEPGAGDVLVTRNVDASTNIFKVVPAARIVFPVVQRLDVYGDAGLGLYYARTSVDLPGGGSADDSTTSLTMRFGAGGRYAVTDALTLSGEFNFNPYFGDFDTNTWGLLVGLGLRL